MRLCDLAGGLALLLMAGFATAAWAGEVVRTPRLVSEHVVDCSSVDTIVASIIKRNMTPRAKAEAVYEFVRNYRFHWPPAREGLRRDDFEYGIVYDPIKLLNVYGYGYCFQCAPLLEALYQAAGLEARGCGIGGHSICEVYYDGDYHFYDSDQHGFCRLADGKTVANMDQLSRDPLKLVLNQPNPSEPFFPATKNPRVPYESKVLVAAYFASRDSNYVRHDKVQIGHRMDVSLAPGMRYIRSFEPKGQWNYCYKDIEVDLKNAYVDAAVGPKDPLGDKAYGNGQLLWQPDLSSATNEYRAGVFADGNIAQDERGLLPATAGKPAFAIFRVRLPYVIVGWPTSWTDPVKPVGAAVVSASFVREGVDDSVAISVSADGGRTWATVWKDGAAQSQPDAREPRAGLKARGQGPARVVAGPTGSLRAVVDFSEQVVGQYEYLLRIELAGKSKVPGCRVEQLAISTAFQLNPAALPALRAGKSKMSFSLGEQADVSEFTADFSTGETFLRDVEEVRGIQFTPGRIRSRAGQVGEVVYKIEPPRPGSTVRSLNVTAGCRREPGQLHYLDDVKVYYAENEPRDWKLLCDDDVPPYMGHWSYYLNGQARCAASAKRLFVKVALRTADSAALQHLRLGTNWLCDGEQGLPARGVRIEHGWAEGDVEKRFETVVTDAPAEYIVEAGPGAVNKWVAIEPVRDPSLKDKWRPNDPPIERPKMAEPNLVDPATRDEMQSLVRAIDADPQANLPKAAASKNEWLADGARQAIAMFKASYPLVEPDNFGSATLSAAGRLAGLAAAPLATDLDKLSEALQATKVEADQATLAAALLLLGDKRGLEPLARAVKAAPPGLILEPVVVLLRAGDPAGGQAARAILADPNTYMKLRFLDAVRAARVPAMPDDLLAGLADPSRWVRLATLELFRGSASPGARRQITRTSREDKVEFLRGEAASVLATMK